MNYLSVRALARSIGLTLGLLSINPTGAGASLRFVHAQLGETRGLEGAISAALSPDGRHLYVASITAHALVVFSRDPATGAITFLEAIFDNFTNPVLTKGGVPLPDGLRNAADVVVSPDGRFVYTAGWGDSAIGIFERGPAGAVTYLSKVTDPRLDGVSGVEISADGSRLWTTAFNAASLCLYDRDLTDGSLTLGQCTVDPTALQGARQLVLSSGGQRALVASKTSDTLSWLDAGSALGLQVMADGQNGVSGLDGAYAVALSPDEDDVYVASFEGQRVVHLSRQGNGYNFVASHDPGLGSGMLAGVWVHPSGTTLFAARNDANVLLRAHRDPLTGALSAFTAGAFPGSLASQVGLTGSTGGRELYTATLSGLVRAIRPTHYPSPSARIHTTGSPAMPLISRITDLALSPNRSSLFSAGDSGLVKFSVDPLSGALHPVFWRPVAGTDKTLVMTPQDELFQVEAGSGLIHRRDRNLNLLSTTNSSLTTIADLALTPSGDRLYALSQTGRLVAFDVAPDGILFEHPQTLASSGFSSLAVAPNGAFLIVASENPHQMASFRWESNRLILVDNYAAGVPPGTRSPGIAFSPDSRHVYITGLSSDFLHIFPFAADGDLTQFPQAISGLPGASSVAVSEDGTHVFVTSAADNRLWRFRRTAASGSLTPVSALQNGVGTVRGLLEPRVVVATASRVYVGSHGSPFANLGSGVSVFETTLFSDGFETGDTRAWN